MGQGTGRNARQKTSQHSTNPSSIFLHLCHAYLSPMASVNTNSLSNFGGGCVAIRFRKCHGDTLLEAIHRNLTAQKFCLLFILGHN